MAKNTARFDCAVIGLGNIGFRFGLDPKRKETWTHVDAYRKSAATRLVGAVEIDPENARLFEKENPGIPVYRTVKELFDNHSIDMVSLCVPTEKHFSVFSDVVGRGARAVFCEKPLSCSVRQSEEMVRMARDRGVVLAVNYTRRWEASCRQVKVMIERGKIGEITAVHSFYPGRIYSIGSHLFNTLMFLTRIRPASVSAVRVDNEKDPSLSGFIKGRTGVIATFLATGRKEDLVFEIDIIGRKGRLRLLDNGNKIEWSLFKESRRYSGYKELVRQPMPAPVKNDRFTDAVNDIARVLEGKRKSTLCPGEDGLLVDAIIEKALVSAGKDGKPEFFK